MNFETVYHIVGGSLLLSAFFWGIISSLRTRIAVLEVQITTHLRDEDGMRRKLDHIDKTLTDLALNVEGLVGVLKGKNVINGDSK